MTKHERSTRAFITERDGLLLAFLSKFAGADETALSYLANKADTPFTNIGGDGLTKPSGIEKRLQKLMRLGAVTKYRNPVNGVRHYGTTPLGYEAALLKGYTLPAHRAIDGLSISRLEHYRQIAHIAAQFASPANLFADSLGVTQVPLERLVSENEMAKALAPVERLLKEARERGNTRAELAEWRTDLLARLQNGDAADGVPIGEWVSTHPALLTVATKRNNKTGTKTKHQPDLAVLLDPAVRTPTNPTARNLLVEVELSPKTGAEYEEILRTFRLELTKGGTYGRVIYFVKNNTIGNAIKRADQRAETGLIASKRLVILPVNGPDPHRTELPTRVPANPYDNTRGTVPNLTPPTPVVPATTAQHTRGVVPNLSKTPTPTSDAQDAQLDELLADLNDRD